ATAGLGALRRRPPGADRVRASADVKRDRERGCREAQESPTCGLAEGDTAVVPLVWLAADATPANVIRAEARDSLHVRVHLDDHLDPARGVAATTTAPRLLPGTTPWPTQRVMPPPERHGPQGRLRAPETVARAESLAPP